MDANVLESNLANPKEFADNSLKDVSAGSGIPVALLVGNQTGRLAGDQDNKGFLSQVQSRRVDFGSELISSALGWLIEYGILSSSKYEITWPDALAMSSGERIDVANKMTDTNQKNLLAGGRPVFTEDEIREEAGYDPEEISLPNEDLDDDLDDEEVE